MNFSAEYLEARRALLDGLDALSDHLDSLVLVGAQAVYMWTQNANLNGALMTRDADLAIDVSRLESVPLLNQVLADASFTLMENGDPGQWLAPNGVEVDLMVANHQAGKGRRSADLSPHAHKTARRSAGLSPSLLDFEVKEINALTSGDSRIFHIRVAGPAALIVAKITKLMERSEQGRNTASHRINPKDAFDIYRLLLSVSAEDLALGFQKHKQQDPAYQESQTAVQFLADESRKEANFLPQLVAKSLYSAGSEDAQNFIYLVEDLLDALDKA